MRSDVKDLTGKRFGKIKVLGYAYGTYNATFWNVRCDCGREYACNGAYLKDGRTTQCFKCSGKARKNPQRAKDPRYWRKWQTLIERWGDKGMVSRRWKKFENFKKDTYSTYKPGYRIQRKDKNLPYSKENAHWIIPGTASKTKRGEIVDFH